MRASVQWGRSEQMLADPGDDQPQSRSIDVWGPKDDGMNGRSDRRARYREDMLRREAKCKELMQMRLCD